DRSPGRLTGRESPAPVSKVTGLAVLLGQGFIAAPRADHLAAIGDVDAAYVARILAFSAANSSSVSRPWDLISPSSLILAMRSSGAAAGGAAGCAAACCAWTR